MPLPAIIWSEYKSPVIFFSVVFILPFGLYERVYFWIVFDMSNILFSPFLILKVKGNFSICSVIINLNFYK